MASSLLTSAEQSEFKTIFQDHFPTFNRNITIFKSPQAVVQSNFAPVYPGYGPSSNINNITSYNKVSGVYPALITYLSEQKTAEIPETRVNVPSNAKVKIKVEQNCRDFIENGKTEIVFIDNVKCNIVSEPGVTNYLGQVYYHYYLSQTK